MYTQPPGGIPQCRDDTEESERNGEATQVLQMEHWTPSGLKMPMAMVHFSNSSLLSIALISLPSLNI